MAGQLTPAQVGLVQSRNSAAQTMVYVLADTGSGQFLPAVERFQQVWNMSRPATIEQLRLVASPSQLDALMPLTASLVEDGRYGPKTAGALTLIVGTPAPPTRASAMPVWYAQNKARVDQLAPINVEPVQAIIDPIEPAPPVPMNQQVINSASNSGSMAQSLIGNDEGPPGAPLNQVSMVAAPVPGDLLPELDAARDMPAGSPEVPLEVAMSDDVVPVTRVVVNEIPFEEEGAPILGTRRKGLYPFVAVGIGAGVLGGVLWYFTRRGRRRRAA